MILILSLFTTFAFAQTDSLERISISPGIDKSNAPRVQAPGSTDYLGPEYLNRQTSSDLSGQVKGLPNVEFTGGPRGEAQLPQIRGLGADRILILEEGVRQNFSSGHNGRVFGDFSLMENIEIVKGPWSSLYGSGALGGVVSCRRSTAADLIRRHGQDQGVQLALDGGTARENFGQRTTGFAKMGKFEPLVSFRHSRGHDVRLGDGRQLDYSSSETYDYYSSLGYRMSEKQDFTLKLNRFEDRSLTPLEPEAEISATNEAAKYFSRKQDVVGDYNLAGSNWDFHAKPYYRETSIEKIRVRDGRVDRQTVQTLGVDAWNNWNLNLGEWLKSTITLGSEFFQDRNNGQRNKGELSSFPDGKGQQLGIYLQPSTVLFKKLTLTPGARYDSYEQNAESTTAGKNRRDKISLKAYADLEYIEGKRFFFGWSQAFNAPRLQDLYISGMHFPGNFFQANPDLKPELAETFEGGVKNKFKLNEDQTLLFDAAYFVTNAKDFIARQVDIPGGKTQFQNVDRVRLHGLESSVLYNHALWGAGLAYGQTRSMNKASGEPLADTAADQLSLTLQVYPTDVFVVGTQLRQVFAQNRVPNGSVRSPGYFVEDFFATYRKGPWDIRLRLDNAFDRDYRPHTSGVKSTGWDLNSNVAYTF